MSDTEVRGVHSTLWRHPAIEAWYAEHEHRGEERSLPARYVQPHTLYRHRTLEASDAGHHLQIHRAGLLGDVKASDIVGCHGYGLFHLVADPVGRGGDLVGSQGYVGELHAVISQSHVAQGFVSA